MENTNQICIYITYYIGQIICAHPHITYMSVSLSLSVSASQSFCRPLRISTRSLRAFACTTYHTTICRNIYVEKITQFIHVCVSVFRCWARRRSRSRSRRNDRPVVDKTFDQAHRRFLLRTLCDIRAKRFGLCFASVSSSQQLFEPNRACARAIFTHNIIAQPRNHQ